MAVALLAGCGDTAEADLCAQYADLVTAADQMRQQDPLTATADELRQASEDVEAELDQFQAVAEGRLDTAISTLRASVEAVRQAAIAADNDALATTRPLMQDAMDDAVQAWATLQDLAEVQCNAA